MTVTAELSHAGRIARVHDPDRFLITLFAPASRREALFLLIAFNHELVRALEIGSAHADSGPIAGLIRLQWWREVVEGAGRRHELAEPLAEALEAGRLERATLLEIIEAREAEAEGVATMEAWRAMLLGGAGGVQVGFAQVLGIRDEAMLTRARAIGAAYGAGATRRFQRALAQAGRIPVPDAVLQQAGRGADAVVTEAGREWLSEAGQPRPGRQAVAAILPAVLARRDLSRPPHSAPRGLGDKLSLISAWLRGFP